MLYLVTGGSGSGKSGYAEQLAVRLHHSMDEAGKLYYVATMYPYDETETAQRIARHRAMRQGKGFETREQYTDIGCIDPDRRDVLLIECMSNLLANEMYMDDGSLREIQDIKDLCESADCAIIGPILDMAGSAFAVVVVTNEIFSDGSAEYCDTETRNYIRLLGYINRRLGMYADETTEVVCGIPVRMKGERKEESHD